MKGIEVDFMQREDQWMVNYYAREERAVAAADRLRIHLAPGGGWVAHIVPR